MCAIANSNSKCTEHEEQLLLLGLNYKISPTKFPIVKYIGSTEKLCQELESKKNPEEIEKAARIRNIMIKHLRIGYKLKLKSNLTKVQGKPCQQ